MRMIKLQDLAQIEISNVDKKTVVGEKSVRLCNFVDVYYNWAITEEMRPDLMEATAKESQIEKFTLHKGQVAITKDSETRDDIGVAAYIADNMPDVILGYHCILITPNENLINGKYLNVIFHSPYAQKYFEANASGSGQRYTLTNEIVGNFPIPVIELEKQKQIGNRFSCIDRKIANNNAICSDLESMAKLLYDYWFVQFDFPDENSKPYKSSGGKMVWNEELKREIPEGWSAKAIGECIASSKNGDWGNEHPKAPDDIEVRCFRGADFPSITTDYHPTAPIRYISRKNRDRLLSAGDLVTEISGGSPTQATGRIGYINQKFLDRSNGIMDCSNFCKAFTPIKPCYQYWLYQTWKSYYDAGAMFNYESKTTGIKNLMFDEFVESILVAVPDEAWLEKYNSTAAMLYDKIQDSFIESEQLASLRDFLLPMLMNGQVKVR